MFLHVCHPFSVCQSLDSKVGKARCIPGVPPIKIELGWLHSHVGNMCQLVTHKNAPQVVPKRKHGDANGTFFKNICAGCAFVHRKFAKFVLQVVVVEPSHLCQFLSSTFC